MKAATPTAVHVDADLMLLEIAQVTRDLAEIKDKAEMVLSLVREAWKKKLNPLQSRLKDIEKGLTQLMKAQRGVFFDGVDRCELPHGALVHAIEGKVKKVKGLLENLEALGLVEGIKIIKEVDWEALEAWPDEKLIMAGTERKIRETFAYEIKGVD